MQIDFAEINRAALGQLQLLLERWLPDGKRVGHEFVSLNPTRADNKPGSFSINLRTGEWGDFATNDKGGDVPSLYAYLNGLKQGEAAKELAAQLGITDRSAANGKGNGHAASSSNAERRKAQEYIYRNADGQPYLRVDRYSDKSFPQYHWTGTEWVKGKPSGPKIPYRLPDLLGAVHDTVLVCEGEKDADALAQRSFVATTASEGAGKWTADLNPYFEGKTVYILPDNDEAGAKHAEQVASNLHGIAREVRIVNLPGLPAGGDVSDWLAASGDTSKLVDIAKQAPIWTPEEAQPSNGANFPLYWHGETDDRPLREWAVEEMLPKRGTALISGQWGTYKTFVALDLAASAMTRSTFAGRAVNRQGGVLFIALEGQDEIKVRLAAVIQEKVIAAATDADIATVNPAAMPFVWAETCPKLTSDGALPALRMIFAAAADGMQKRFGLPLVLAEIDTLSPAADFKDANDSAENQRVMTVLKTLANEFDVCVVAVDHFGKDVSTGTRNSSVKEADVDAVLALLGERDLAGNVSNPRMAIRKVRGAPTGKEIRFDKRVVTVEDRGQTFSTLVVDWVGGGPADEPAKKSKWPKSLAILKRALDVTMADFGRMVRPFPDGPEVQAVDREKVRDEFLRIYPADNHNAKRESFRRAEKDAVEREVMVSREIGNVTLFWSADRSTP